MRQCEECYVCCYETQIDSINKPAGELCKHYKDGCSIYDTRPAQCKDYTCLWLEGLGEDKDRPDRSGLIVDTKIIEGSMYICAREIREDVDRGILDPINDVPLPVLYKTFNSTKETGDLVIISDTLKPRCKALMGKKIDDNTYELKIENGSNV